MIILFSKILICSRTKAFYKKERVEENEMVTYPRKKNTNKNIFVVYKKKNDPDTISIDFQGISIFSYFGSFYFFRFYRHLLLSFTYDTLQYDTIRFLLTFKEFLFSLFSAHFTFSAFIVTYFCLSIVRTFQLYKWFRDILWSTSYS